MYVNEHHLMVQVFLYDRVCVLYEKGRVVLLVEGESREKSKARRSELVLMVMKEGRRGVPLTCVMDRRARMRGKGGRGGEDGNCVRHRRKSEAGVMVA